MHHTAHLYTDVGRWCLLRDLSREATPRQLALSRYPLSFSPCLIEPPAQSSPSKNNILVNHKDSFHFNNCATHNSLLIRNTFNKMAGNDNQAHEPREPSPAATIGWVAFALLIPLGVAIVFCLVRKRRAAKKERVRDIPRLRDIKMLTGPQDPEDVPQSERRWRRQTWEM